MKSYNMKEFFEYEIKEMKIHNDNIHCGEDCPFKKRDYNFIQEKYYCQLTYQFIENNERNHICLEIKESEKWED